MKHSPIQRLATSAVILLLSHAVVFNNTVLAQAPKQPPVTTLIVTPMAAARFLEQAAFGPNSATVAQVQSMGLSAWIDAQIALDSSQWSPIPDPSIDTKGNASAAPTQAGFFVNAVNGPDQLRQRVALALSEIWVVSGVKLDARAISPYLRLLQADAFTTYDKIMYDVTLSPAMGHYLDMVNNNKPTSGHEPDQNYAREVLQLFTIGLDQLDSYGRLATDSNGAPVPTFNTATVQGFASAFTGWTYAPAAGATSKFGNPANWTAPMVAFENNHDMTAKTLLNGYVMPAGQTAEEDLAGALTNIFQHPNVAPFICRQLIQRLVSSNPSDAYVGRIVSVFNQSPRGSMAAVVKAILLDPEARQGDDGTENAATKLREPILWISTFLRGLNATVAPTNSLTGSATNLGQELYYSPSVFNYFAPGFRIAVSPTESITAPEFQLLSEATADSAADLVNSFVYGTVGGVTISLTPYTTILGTKPNSTTIAAMVDQLNTDLMGGRMPDPMRRTILFAVPSGGSAKAIAEAAVYLIGSSWNYQVEQ